MARLNDGSILIAGGRGGLTEEGVPVGTTNVDAEMVNAIPWLSTSERLVPGTKQCES